MVGAVPPLPTAAGTSWWLSYARGQRHTDRGPGRRRRALTTARRSSHRALFGRLGGWWISQMKGNCHFLLSGWCRSGRCSVWRASLCWVPGRLLGADPRGPRSGRRHDYQWCVERDMELFAVARAHTEPNAHWLEERGRARATIARAPVHDRVVLPVRRRGAPHRGVACGTCPPPEAGLRASGGRVGRDRTRRRGCWLPLSSVVPCR